MNKRTGSQPNCWFPDSDHVPQFRLSLPGVCDEIGTPDAVLAAVGDHLAEMLEEIDQTKGLRCGEQWLDNLQNYLSSERIE
jgi:hypothetical protein